MGGILQQCPSGRYGASEGMTSPQCTGECYAGFYCPSGSVSPTQFECGGPEVFCPSGSAWPTVRPPRLSVIPTCL